MAVDMPPAYTNAEVVAIYAEHRDMRSTNITSDCKTRISMQYNIPEPVLDAFLMTENAPSGHIRINSNNTYDVGPMQINSDNWPMIFDSLDINPIQLRFNGCDNLEAGAYIIRDRLDRKKKHNIKNWDDFFSAIGNYHSYTPMHNSKYAQTWKKNFNKILETRYPTKPNRTDSKTRD